MADESTAQALARLASAYEHLAGDVGKMANHQAEMNGNVAQNVLGIALWAQWGENHTGDDGLHAMLRQNVETLEKQNETLEKQIEENTKLGKTAVRVQIILALGLTIGTILVAVR